MKVFITGATGFVGGEIVEQLKRGGHSVTCLVRPQSPSASRVIPEGARIASGDVLDGDLDKHISGHDAVIHLVGIIRAFPRKGITFEKFHHQATINVVAAMKNAGVKRLVHMSALGAGPDSKTDYFKTKWSAESAVKDSGLEWSVMKPSVIFGPRDQFVNMLAGQVRVAPVVPVIGDGKYLMQPIAVADVAAGFAGALTRPETIGQTYEAGGPERLTYNDLLDAIARAVGKPRARKVHLPLALMRPAIGIGENIDFFPITLGQLDMLLMNNVCDPAPYFKTFGISPTRFADGIQRYLRR